MREERGIPHLEGRILRGDLREADYVAEVDCHRLVILRWYLVGILVNARKPKLCQVGMIERQRNASAHLLNLLELLGDARRKHLEEQRVALALLALQLARLLRQIRGVHLQASSQCSLSAFRFVIARIPRELPQGNRRLSRDQMSTWMVATALRISMMMMGDTTSTRTTMAMPATSLLLASCNVELTYSLVETDVSCGRSIRLANSVQHNVRQCDYHRR